MNTNIRTPTPQSSNFCDNFIFEMGHDTSSGAVSMPNEKYKSTPRSRSHLRHRARSISRIRHQELVKTENVISTEYIDRSESRLNEPNNRLSRGKKEALNKI